ncbi:MAG: type II toxin-antitoxin system RelE/ParE family toxin [Verrucomicrobiota bacterium]
MALSVEFLSENVEQEFEALPLDMKAKFEHITHLITEHGLHEVGMPYVRHLHDKLWEMRLKGRDGISRALYVTALEERVVVIRVFVKKTQKTPSREIKLALKRAKEVEDE